MSTERHMAGSYAVVIQFGMWFPDGIILGIEIAVLTLKTNR